MNIPSILIIISVFLVVFICLCGLIATSARARPAKEKHSLQRHQSNPVISPLPYREWEMNGTFNPAAFEDDEGKVHLLYRALGDDGISRVGHAVSDDGINFPDRSSYPVFTPMKGIGFPDKSVVHGPAAYDQAVYTSGGGWGGSEDPRTVRIGDRVYMTYVAFEGWESVRIALTSISLKDIKKGRWNWRKPFLISPAGETNKNWVLFPEKVNGKYAVLHSLVPKIQIEYADNLDYFTGYIKSPRLHGPQPGRPEFWDNRIRGSGPPPIKTELGWLLLYHAQDDRDPGKYKLGAMILDSNDPTRILYRSPTPILEPDMPYENDGKPGVVYASGAVIRGHDLYIYYGGGDRHTCVAQTPLKELLGWLQKYGKV